MPYTPEDRENDRVLKLIYVNLDKFTDIYLEGNETNCMPENVQISVYCESDEEKGFVFNIKSSELGLTYLIAEKWILHSELEEIIGELILG